MHHLANQGNRNVVHMTSDDVKQASLVICIQAIAARSKPFLSAICISMQPDQLPVQAKLSSGQSGNLSYYSY